MTTTARVHGPAKQSPVARYQMYIDGRFVDGQDNQTLEVYDPSTEEAIATVPAGKAADIDRAAQAATRAFYQGWKGVTAQERGRILFRLAERVRARRAELAELETRNTGKPIAESEYDIDDTATCFEYYGGLEDRTGAGRRLHGSPEAGGADPPDHPGAGQGF